MLLEPQRYISASGVNATSDAHEILSGGSSLLPELAVFICSFTTRINFATIALYVGHLTFMKTVYLDFSMI